MTEHDADDIKFWDATTLECYSELDDPTQALIRRILLLHRLRFPGSMHGGKPLHPWVIARQKGMIMDAVLEILNMDDIEWTEDKYIANHPEDATMAGKGDEPR